MKVVVVVPVVVRAVKMSSWNLEEESPIIRCMAGIRIITCQEVKVLLRFSSAGINSGRNFRSPKLPSIVGKVEDLEVDLVNCSVK